MNHNELPGIMPIDMLAWMKTLGKSTFINAYYQYRDLLNISNNKKILVVGPGQGLIVAILKWKNFDVMTIDVDPETKPDFVCSVHDMKIFHSNQFDVAVVSHVLEHVPPDLFDNSISELSRVAPCTILYLPISGKHFSIKIDFGIRNLFSSVFYDFINPFKQPNPTVPIFCERQHYWELGVPGYRKKDVNRRLMKYFTIKSQYRNEDWPVSYNYILESIGSKS